MDAEQQVASAALALVRPTTDGKTRTEASQFLEQWTRTPEAWEVYVKWLRSFRISSRQDVETRGMQLLCLTLLQSKIRREVPRGSVSNAALAAIQNEIASFLQQPRGDSQYQRSVIPRYCSCMAALAVRCGTLQEIMTTTTSQHSAAALSSTVTMRLLSSIAFEVEACSDLTTPQVTAELWPYLPSVLAAVRRALTPEEDMTAPLDALRDWTSFCHVTLSHLNTPVFEGSDTILLVLTQILSQSQPARSEILTSASEALTEALLIPTDSCTPSRQAAAASLFNAISHGFVAAPLAYATQQGWDDASHALATLLCTLVTEEVDDICKQPAEPCLHLLLQIQSHPKTSVALAAMECWLTVQEVPTRERHENWKVPLFTRILDGILTRIRYPSSFIDWENELEEDQSEFEELRRMVTDVLVSSYFLLRVQFIQKMATSTLGQNDWTIIESALFCLCTISREVCARIKARGGGSGVSADRDATSQSMLQLVHQLVCGVGGNHPVAAAESAAHQHPLVLARVTNLIGSYAPAWNVLCTAEDLLPLLTYLRVAFMVPGIVVDAAKATRSIFIACSTKLLSIQGQILASVQETMDAVLKTHNEEGMAIVAEGSTRLLTLIKDGVVMRQSLRNLVTPLLQSGKVALDALPVDDRTATAESQIALESLCRNLHTLQVIVRFCDKHNGDDSAHPIADVMECIWPFLEETAQRASKSEIVLDRVLSIHEQLLKNVPDRVAPFFEQTIKFAVDSFTAMKQSSSLKYIGAAAEVFGPKHGAAFKDLLDHITGTFRSRVTTENTLDECTQVICSFFEMTQRFILYAPFALVASQEFPAIVSFAVEGLTLCKGERESTRACLNFLTQLFGWQTLRLSAVAVEALHAGSGIIDEQLARHGASITQACVVGLTGGPQMLWPSYSECVFAVVSHVVSRTEPESSSPQGSDHGSGAVIAQQWVQTALSSCSASNAGNGEAMSPETCQQVCSILMGLARTGVKSKPRAKMLLTDFAKISKGEMAPDALLSYTLQ